MVDYHKTAEKVRSILESKGVVIEFQRRGVATSDAPWLSSPVIAEKASIHCLVLPISEGAALGFSALMKSLVPRVSLIVIVPPSVSDVNRFHSFVHLGHSYGILKVETLAPTGIPALHYVFAGQ